MLLASQFAAFGLSWAMIAAFAFVGPAASFDEARPFAVSMSALRTRPFGTLALVLLMQALLAAAGLAMTSLIVLAGLSTGVVVAARWEPRSSPRHSSSYRRRRWPSV